MRSNRELESRTGIEDMSNPLDNSREVGCVYYERACGYRREDFPTAEVTLLQNTKPNKSDAFRCTCRLVRVSALRHLNK